MNFFDQHSTLTLICLAFFPRITLLVASFVSGGFLWWLGWLFTPHLLVAILSLRYWNENPLLVVIAWGIAFGGTGGEIKATSNRK
jgi:hypothetical protein